MVKFNLKLQRIRSGSLDILGGGGGGSSTNSCKEWNLVIKAFREKIFLMKV